MEVHHHPEVENKTFKAYLLEGLMIFLAVFMGFIAENIREYISDHNKEKEYIFSMISDLRQDSTNLADIMKASARLSRGQDTLINWLSDSAENQNFDKRAYYLFFRYATSIAIFNSTDRAITQLTSSGNFRLIGSQRVADSISSYYDKVKNASLQETMDSKAADDCFIYAQNVFNLRYALHPSPVMQMITHQPQSLLTYTNKLVQLHIAQQYYVQDDLRDVYTSCTGLMKFLEQEYGITH